MLIVNQDKDKIFNFNNITNIWIEEDILDETTSDFEICVDGESLGYYATEERAKEVLQEIIKAYKNEGLRKIDTIMIDEKVVFEMPIE